MTNTNPTYRTTAAGSIVEVDARGRASFLGCSWLVQVPSGNPEPDSLADCYVLRECGAKVRPHPAYVGDPRVVDVLDATICDNGHDRVAYHIEHDAFGPAWEREQVERYEEGHRWVA